MLTWAAIVVFLLGLVAYLAGDLSVVLSGAAELGAVIALFALVCAAEAFN
jgi:hypothetical protein